MGEELSGGGVPSRRREPGSALSDPWYVRDGAALETVLAAAIRTDGLDPQAEQRAVAAFRVARDTGAHRARTRRRDDWRLPEERRARRPVKITFGVAVASLTLGGVAVAAIGSARSAWDGAGGGRETARPSAAAPHRPGDTAPSTSSGGPRPTDRPASAKDTEAHCRAYAHHVQGHGKALDAKAWHQLVAAAGGKAGVADYCSEQLRRATATPGGRADTGKSGKGAAGADNGATGRTGTSGKSGASGKTTGGTGDTAGKSRAGGGQSGGKHK
ncbi:hypothetical protein BFF78_12270 [Streptomyces fodineus]|uniref:Uncharacterized protein n=1 Tax=Streptomyces fodineus TaxID=1904616 RepID=A0A1D7Y895_9ACTN|nr:hypothetical protein [Streptomyces fodineus]AOR31724.1 hypothetical protein BFF78_12270 [Streptomyces fodineus]